MILQGVRVVVSIVAVMTLVTVVLATLMLVGIGLMYLAIELFSFLA